MSEENGWVFFENHGEYMLPDVLFASVKAVRNRDGLSFGQWAIVLRYEDVAMAHTALRRVVELQIAQHEEDE